MLPATVVCKVKQGWMYISQQDKEAMTDHGSSVYVAFFLSIRLHLSGKAQTSLSPCVSSFWEHPENASLILIICSSVSLESGFNHLQQQLPLTCTQALSNQRFFCQVLTFYMHSPIMRRTESEPKGGIAAVGLVWRLQDNSVSPSSSCPARSLPLLFTYYFYNVTRHICFEGSGPRQWLRDEEEPLLFVG